MVMNEVTLTNAPSPGGSLVAGDHDFAITMLVDSIERVLQHGRKSTSLEKLTNHRFDSPPKTRPRERAREARPWINVHIADSPFYRRQVFW